MKYYKYNSIYNYMMSSFTKDYPPFNDVRLYLTNVDTPTTFKPKNKVAITMTDYGKYFLNAGKSIKGIKSQEGVMNNNALHNVSIITDADPTGDFPAEGSYEKILGEPAWKNGQKCPFIQSYKGRARNEATMNGEGKLSDIEAIKRSFAWDSSFNEDEYRRYSIPLTPVNQDTTCLVADNAVVSAREKFLAKGVLIANRIDDYLFPIGFMYWENPSYYNQYVFNWNPNGVFQVK